MTRKKLKFQFGSWTFSGKEIDLQPGEFDMSDFIENGEWVILSRFKMWIIFYQKT